MNTQNFWKPSEYIKQNWYRYIHDHRQTIVNLLESWRDWFYVWQNRYWYQINIKMGLTVDIKLISKCYRIDIIEFDINLTWLWCHLISFWYHFDINLISIWYQMTMIHLISFGRGNVGYHGAHRIPDLAPRPVYVNPRPRPACKSPTSPRGPLRALCVNPRPRPAACVNPRPRLAAPCV